MRRTPCVLTAWLMPVNPILGVSIWVCREALRYLAGMLRYLCRVGMKHYLAGGYGSLRSVAPEVESEGRCGELRFRWAAVRAELA